MESNNGENSMSFSDNLHEQFLESLIGKDSKRPRRGPLYFAIEWKEYSRRVNPTPKKEINFEEETLKSTLFHFSKEFLGKLSTHIENGAKGDLNVIKFIEEYIEENFV